jgi:hypothetical protein
MQKIINLGLNRRKKLYWPLTRRGFFSEVLISLLVMYYGSTVKKETMLLASAASFIPYPDLREFINYTLLKPVHASNCFDLFGFTLKGRLLQFFNYTLRRGAVAPAVIFNKIWLQDELGLNSKWNDEMLAWFCKALNSLIVIPSKSKDLISSLPFIDALVDGYICIHVRRGDKLVSEANAIKVTEYLKKIPLTLYSLPLVIISDDCTAYCETLEAVAALGISKKVYTTASDRNRGYDNQSHYSNSLSTRFEDLYLLLADYSLALESSYFIGTYSSNVGRAIYIARNGKSVSSVDGEFRFIW